jgi:hypothetical protein
MLHESVASHFSPTIPHLRDNKDNLRLYYLGKDETSSSLLILACAHLCFSMSHRVLLWPGVLGHMKIGTRSNSGIRPAIHFEKWFSMAAAEEDIKRPQQIAMRQGSPIIDFKHGIRDLSRSDSSASE